MAPLNHGPTEAPSRSEPLRHRRPSAKRRIEKRSPADVARLRRTVEACRHAYGRYPSVVGIGTGLKFTGGRRIADAPLCIHFYVRRKLRRAAGRRLPRFVYSRKSDGSVDRSRRIPTDVIELKRLRFACRSGDQLEAIGELGTLTILFRDKGQAAERYYLVTCAHVAGDVRQSPPVDPALRGRCCISGDPLARTLVNSVQQAGQVTYDVALAELAEGCTPQPDLMVVGSSHRLTGFFPAAQIHPGMSVSCAFPVSNVVAATVASGRTTLPLTLDGVEYHVANLFLIDRGPLPGDSGGLLYDGSDAIGILVGVADGWGLFQPLEEAFSFLRQLSPVPIRCF